MTGYMLVESPEMLAKLLVNGWIVDGRSGGLVRGRLHSEGHVLMIQPTHSLGVYEFVGYMEGGEYLMSTDATALHFQRLQEINEDKDEKAPELPAPIKGRILDTRAEPHDKLLLVHRQFVINQRSTRKYCDELIALNDPHPFHCGRVFTDEELAAMQD